MSHLIAYKTSYQLHVEPLEERALLAAGDLDRGFGDGGRVVTDVNDLSVDEVRDVAVDAEGRIVAVGFSFSANSPTDFAVARYHPDGVLDWRVLTDFGFSRGTAQGVAIQSDGKVVVVGTATTEGDGFGTDLAVVRYNTDGTLDTTFHDDGIRIGNLGLPGVTEGTSVLVFNNGREDQILLGGFVRNTNDFLLARLNSDGFLDTDFGEGGVVLTDFPEAKLAELQSLAVQSDGKIVAAGSVERAFGDDTVDIALARYDSQFGDLDTSFGAAGRVIDSSVPGHQRAENVALQEDGKIVVAGEVSGRLLAARYTQTGSPDPTFGADGHVPLVDPGNPNRANPSAPADLAIQSDGRIVVMGTNDFGALENVVVYRLLSNGELDRSFGGDGGGRLDLGPGADHRGHALAWQDDEIIVAGSIDLGGPSDPNTSRDFFVARVQTSLFSFVDFLRLTTERIRDLILIDRGDGIDGLVGPVPTPAFVDDILRDDAFVGVPALAGELPPEGGTPTDSQFERSGP